MPSNSARGPLATFTVWPTSRDVEVFFGTATPADASLRCMILLNSARVRGDGVLLSGPTNPVTPGVLRTTAQLRSFISMRTST